VVDDARVERARERRRPRRFDAEIERRLRPRLVNRLVRRQRLRHVRERVGEAYAGVGELLHHPRKPGVGKARFVLRIAAADVRVRADEPDLLDAGAAVPRGDREVDAALVDRHRVESGLDRIAQLGVDETEEIVAAVLVVLGDPQRADGIPDAERADRHIRDQSVPRKLQRKDFLRETQRVIRDRRQPAGALERQRLRLGPCREREPVRGRLVGGVVGRTIEQAHLGDQSAESPRGVRTATEADDVDPVAGVVMPGDERMAAHDPRDDAQPENAAEHLLDGIARVTHTVDVLRDLHDGAVRVAHHLLLLVAEHRRLRRRLPRDVREQLDDVGDVGVRDLAVRVVVVDHRDAGLVLGAVPRAVGTKHDVLRHDVILPSVR